MKTAYVITRGDDLGGAQIHVRDVSVALRSRGHAVTVFGGRRGVFSRQLSDHGVRYVEIPELERELNPLRDAGALHKLRGALRNFAPDLVSTHCAKAGVLGRIAAKSLAIPALFTAHGWSFSEGVPPRRRLVYRWMERGASPLADRVIVVCKADGRTAVRERVVRRGKLRLVYNGMRDIAATQRARAHSAPVRLVTIARLCEQKDHITLLRALAQLRDLEWHLDHIGDGPLREHAARLAAELRLSQRISFLGLRENVVPMLSRAQLYLLVSNWEGFPRSILEAMRAGLPVVATDVGGVREAVVDGTTGFLVGRSSEGQLAQRLRQLFESPALRLSMGEAGRVRYEQRFTFDRMIDDTLGVYGELCSRRSSAYDSRRARREMPLAGELE
ncbi:MAG: glycosyltransferase family 4 protein [Myxococcota bacterium]